MATVRARVNGVVKSCVLLFRFARLGSEENGGFDTSLQGFSE